MVGVGSKRPNAADGESLRRTGVGQFGELKQVADERYENENEAESVFIWLVPNLRETLGWVLTGARRKSLVCDPAGDSGQAGLLDRRLPKSGRTRSALVYQPAPLWK